MKNIISGDMFKRKAHSGQGINLYFLSTLILAIIFSMSNVGFADTDAAKYFFLTQSYYEFPLIAVDPSTKNTFATPIAWYKDSLYTVNVEPPDGVSNMMNLKTVVRKGTIGSDGIWTWEQKTIEGRTLEDPFHTQPSIAVDKDGYIHVAYNMHNMPWQYKVSTKPGDISKFEFKGEPLSIAQLAKVKFENATHFPYIGTAAIPGTQITYPSFFKDRNNELYITYRFATKPLQSWSKRGLAGGIARYDTGNKTWMSIGGDLTITKDDVLYPDNVTDKSYIVHPFAYQDKWTVYSIRLFFDVNNSMHVSWTWREGGPGPDCSYPSYAFSDGRKNIFKKANGEVYKLPIMFQDVDLIYNDANFNKVWATTSITTDGLQQPNIIVSPIGAPCRVLVSYDKSKKKWLQPENTPWSATEIYIDDNAKQWAVASGINIFNRDNRGTPWSHMLRGGSDYVWAKVIYVKELNGFFIHALAKKSAKYCKLIWFKTSENLSD